jgi:hypothetical protein
LADASNGILALRPAANSLARRTGGTVVLDESLELQLETPITEELEGEPPGTTAPARREGSLQSEGHREVVRVLRGRVQDGADRVRRPLPTQKGRTDEPTVQTGARVGAA